jgi:hypothetical protein
MKIKTSDLTLLALDWAAAKCEVGEDISEIDDPHFYSTDWAIGGPIIEREGLLVRPSFTDERDKWTSIQWAPKGVFESGPTPLVAAMRCYVASVLGDEVDIPEELL